MTLRFTCSAMLYSFSEFELDTEQSELRQNGAPVHLEPQAFDLLQLLVERAGRVVSRDEIHAAIWGDRIVSDAALASRIRDVRRALGDDGREQRFLRTVKGRGLRFVTEVISVANQIGPAVGETFDATEDIPSVAVLDIDLPASEPELQDLAEQVTDELTAALGAWRQFPVLSRSRAASARSSYCLGGRLSRVEGEIRLLVELIETASGNHIWSGRVSTGEGEVSGVAEKLAVRATGQVVIELEGAEARKSIRKAPDDMTAWELAIRAARVTHRMNPGDLDLALELAHRAADAAPEWIYPRILIADSLFLKAFRALPKAGANVGFTEAHAAARQALDIDGASWNAHSLTGLGELWANRNHDRALIHAEKALELNPSAIKASHFAGCVTGFSDQCERAIALQTRVLALDPTFKHRPVIEADMGLWHFLQGDFGAARQLLDRSVTWFPHFARAYHRRIALFGLTGDTEAAREARGNLNALGEFPSVDDVLSTYPLRNAAHEDMFREGLRKGGLAN
ncbi:MAG: winged helix-turn-helix domain-containing protein [Pseudomonadota bacterium]